MFYIAHFSYCKNESKNTEAACIFKFHAKCKQKLLIKSLTNEQYDVISEIALNIYTGTYPLTKKYINQLIPYQSFIRSLGSREVSAKQKRWILLKHRPIVSLLLKPIVHRMNKEWQEK